MRTFRDIIKDYLQKRNNKALSTKLKNPKMSEEKKIDLLRDSIQKFKDSFEGLKSLNDFNRALKKVTYFYSEIDIIKENQKGELNRNGVVLYNSTQVPLQQMEQTLKTKRSPFLEKSQSSIKSDNSKYKKENFNHNRHGKNDYDKFIASLRAEGLPEFILPTKEGYRKKQEREKRNGKPRTKPRI